MEVIIYFVLNTLLDSDQTVGVRTGLEVPCEALLRLNIQQQTIHVEENMHI